MFSVVLALGFGSPVAAQAQSKSLQEAWRRTDELSGAGKYADAERLAKKALDLAQRESGIDTDDYATSLNDLGLIYEAEGLFQEAEPVLRQAVAIEEKVRPNTRDLATVLNDLAIVYDDEGRYGDAEKLCLRAVEIDEKSARPERSRPFFRPR